jgi:hypothetical protein
MEFAGKEHYDEYSRHPDHSTFVQDFWIKEVEEFMEIDYQPLNGDD